MARSLLRTLRASGAALQALVLSTCNRTEVYAVLAGEHAVGAPGAIGATLASRTRITSKELQRRGYVRLQHDATEHLFAVTAGLHSSVLGETEIVAQTRAALALAVEEGTLGPLLDGLLQHALAAGRRVRSSTTIARGAAATQHRDRPLVVIDLAVPRDVEPASRELRGVILRDIDDVQRIAAANLEERRRELPRARQIIQTETRRFEAWRTGLEADPLLRELRRSADEIRRGELERVIARSPGLHDDEIRRLDLLSRSLVNRLLHEPTLRIRRAGGTASGRELLEALDQLFGDVSSDRVTRGGACEGRSAA